MQGSGYSRDEFVKVIQEWRKYKQSAAKKTKDKSEEVTSLDKTIKCVVIKIITRYSSILCEAINRE